MVNVSALVPYQPILLPQLLVAGAGTGVTAGWRGQFTGSGWRVVEGLLVLWEQRALVSSLDSCALPGTVVLSL